MIELLKAEIMEVLDRIKRTKSQALLLIYLMLLESLVRNNQFMVARPNIGLD